MEEICQLSLSLFVRAEKVRNLLDHLLMEKKKYKIWVLTLLLLHTDQQHKLGIYKSEAIYHCPF